MSFRDKQKTALRDLLESSGPKGAVQVVRECLQEKKISPRDFSLKETWEACTAYESKHDNNSTYWREASEAVSSDLFSTISGEVINAQMIQAYEIPGLIGDKLCRTVKSDNAIEKHAGFDAHDSMDTILEGVEYNQATFGEKWTESPPNLKKGKILLITMEAIRYDKTNQILDHAARIARKCALEREMEIVQGVQDAGVNAGQIYKPSGIAESIYSTDNKNLIASNSFGETGLTSVFKQFQTEIVDSNGDYVFINPENMSVLLPYDIYIQGLQMQQSELVPEGSENAKNIWRNAFQTLTSPYITAQSTSTWFAGDFKSGFRWNEVEPLKTYTMSPNSYLEFMRDIKAGYKVMYLGSLACVDPNYAVKSTA